VAAAADATLHLQSSTSLTHLFQQICPNTYLSTSILMAVSRRTWVLRKFVLSFFSICSFEHKWNRLFTGQNCPSYYTTDSDKELKKTRMAEKGIFFILTLTFKPDRPR